MAIGNTGQPVDPLVVAQFSTATALGGGNTILGTQADSLWTSVGVLLHFDEGSGSVTTDSGPFNLPMTTLSTGSTITSIAEKFGPSSLLLSTGSLAGGFKYPATGNVLGTSPVNLSTGDFTVEGWFNLSTVSGATSPLIACLGATADGR